MPEQSNIAVSVIIPVYNAAPYLRQCLDSVVGQTLREIEVICVDDGSTDGSLDILREYERADSRVRVITQSHENAGAARNKGLDLAAGEYLYFLDADDFIELDLLETCASRAKETAADVVIFNGCEYDDKTGLVSRKGILNERYQTAGIVFAGEDAAEHIFQISAWAYPCNKLFSRNFITRLHLRFQGVSIANDRLFVHTACALASRITVLDKRLVYHRFNTGQNLGDGLTRYQGAGYAADLATCRALKEKGVWDKFRRSFVNDSLKHMLLLLGRADGYAGFREFYLNLRGEGLAELGITGHPKEYFYTPDHYEWLELIIGSEPSEDVYHKLRMFGAGLPLFPTDRVKRGSSIVLYGAGRVGQGYNEWLSNSKYCDVVLWLDKRAEKFGPPIAHPSAIVGARYDHVVVAANDTKIAREIGDDLVSNYGVAPERLVYICE